MLACAEVAVQGLVRCFPEHCKGVAQDARVQAAGPVAFPTSAVRMWPLVGFEFTDGRAECLRVTRDNQRRSLTPSAASSHGCILRTGWFESSLCRRAGATGGGW